MNGCVDLKIKHLMNGCVDLKIKKISSRMAESKLAVLFALVHRYEDHFHS